MKFPIHSQERRQFLRGAATGLGSLALGGLLPKLAHGQDALPHFAPKAKRVIWLHMAGGPSQLDLFDPKPELIRLDGEEIPESYTKGERFAFIKGTPRLLGSPYQFAQHGESGAAISELLPHTAKIADKLTIVRTMKTTQFNHGPAQIFMNTGYDRIGRPSLGSWLDYGLGAEAEDLPGFVVMLSGKFAPSGGNSCWGSGFLPTVHQGVRFRSQGDPVLFLSNPNGVDTLSRRSTLNAIKELDRLHHEATGDPETLTRMAQYEMAHRMQGSMPGLSDLASESPETLALYGAKPGEASFANNCLLARRLLEGGSRFVQLYDWGWDSHGTAPTDDIVTSLAERCAATDRASAALILDLEQRGMLDDTIVVWGGEFGRTPMNERRNGSTFLGRDHHPHAFSMWFAGGGFRPGLTFGETDDLGYFPTTKSVDIHDLHATLLHLLGVDHERLTHYSQGRDFRLTDVGGVVQQQLLS
ncbi:MAG: hypothetical protein ACJAVJ_000619 [Planctomycetota bacterium]|jgi:hypothetical protein